MAVSSLITYGFAGLCFVVLSYVLGAWAKQMRVRYIREVSYDAVAYSTEVAAALEKWDGDKQGSEAKLSMAVKYMQSVFPLMTKTRAERYCISIIAKSPKLGATGTFKI